MIGFLLEYWLIFATGAVILAAVWITVRQVKQKLPELPSSTTDHRVSVNEKGVLISLPDGKAFSLDWNGFEVIRILTTADGPFSEDVFWVFELGNGVEPLVVPNGAPGVDNFIQTAPAHLEGFDHDAVIDAMTSVEADTFLVWERA